MLLSDSRVARHKSCLIEIKILPFLFYITAKMSSAVQGNNLPTHQNSPLDRFNAVQGNNLPTHQNSPLNRFNRLARDLQAAKTPEAWLAVRRVGLQSVKGDVETLLRKHSDVISAFAPLHVLPQFSRNGLTPKQMVDSTKVFWGARWLVTPGEDLSAAVLTNTANFPTSADAVQYLASAFRETDRPPLENVLDSLIKIFDDAFSTHLHPFMLFFGQDLTDEVNPWSAAYTNYIAEVEEKVLALQNELVEVKIEEEDEEAHNRRTCLADLGRRVHAAAHGHINGYPFPPAFESSVPFICPAFVKALFTLFTELSPLLTVVAGWFVPGLRDYEAQRGTRVTNLSPHVTTPSYMCLVLQHLAYFADRHRPEWAENSFNTKDMWYWSSTGNVNIPSASIGELFTDLIIDILAYRSVCLIPAFPTVVSQQAKSKDNTKDSEHEALIDNIVRWTKAAQKQLLDVKIVRNLQAVTPRDAQECPAEVYANDPNNLFTCNPNLRRVFEMTIFNFMNSPGGTNNAAVHWRFVTNIYADYQHLHEVVYPALVSSKPAAPILTLRAGIEHSIRRWPRFQEYQMWYHFDDNKVTNTEQIPLIATTDVQRSAATVAECEKIQVLQAMLRRIGDSFNKGHLCGIRLSDEAGQRTEKTALHPALAAAFKHFAEVAVLVQQDILNIEGNTPLNNNLAAGVWSTTDHLTAFSNATVPFVTTPVATLEQTRSYYPESVPVGVVSRAVYDTQVNPIADFDVNAEPERSLRVTANGQTVVYDRTPGVIARGANDNDKDDGEVEDRVPAVGQERRTPSPDAQVEPPLKKRRAARGYDRATRV
ncbi:hypothetical protein B0H16DRAFT_1777009 [Mycena metata]|uniref:Uncharacterized protein n=1 Tax=Mycena metata TaxID=1033252 RepID=A0AAD7JQQ3_9AGAR|nr:hypothetical protein B0H16DRAFT_1777009 [Mycena metata]